MSERPSWLKAMEHSLRGVTREKTVADARYDGPITAKLTHSCYERGRFLMICSVCGKEFITQFRRMHPGGDVLVNDATKEAIRTAAVSFEEHFHELVERAGWVFEPGSRLPAGEVLDFCRQQGFNQGRTTDFKWWLESEHGVVYRRSNSARYYLGMTSLAHKAAARGRPLSPKSHTTTPAPSPRPALGYSSDTNHHGGEVAGVRNRAGELLPRPPAPCRR